MTRRCKLLQAIDNGEYQKNKKKFELSKNDWNISGDKKNFGWGTEHENFL